MKMKYSTALLILLCIQQGGALAQQKKTLYEINNVQHLPKDVIIDSMNGFGQAAMAVLPITISAQAFSIHSENDIDRSNLAVGQKVVVNLPGRYWGCCFISTKFRTTSEL